MEPRPRVSESFLLIPYPYITKTTPLMPNIQIVVHRDIYIYVYIYRYIRNMYVRRVLGFKIRGGDY